MSCLTLSDEDYNTPINELRKSTKERLSLMLNPVTVIPSPENELPRDWRGLCTLLDDTVYSRCKQTGDPISIIFKFCGAKTTIAYFIQCLEQIDRYDVVEDTKEFMISDIKHFKERQCSSANPTPVVPNENVSTLDDITAIINNRLLPRYDAFLLYDQADLELAENIVKVLETDNEFQICLKDRFYPGIAFQNLTAIDMISKRCNYLIIIISKHFSNNPENIYIMKYILSLTIKQQETKIISCVYGGNIPVELEFRSNIFFNKPNPFSEPWSKLKTSISYNRNLELTNSVDVIDNSPKLKIEEYVNTSSKIVDEETISPYKNLALTNSVDAIDNYPKPKIEEHVEGNKEDKGIRNLQTEKKSKFIKYIQGFSNKFVAKKNLKKKVKFTNH